MRARRGRGRGGAARGRVQVRQRGRSGHEVRPTVGNKVGGRYPVVVGSGERGRRSRGRRRLVMVLLVDRRRAAGVRVNVVGPHHHL